MGSSECMFVWMSWMFARFHEILNQTDTEHFSFLTWQTKKNILKKIMKCTMYHGYFFLWPTDAVLSHNYSTINGTDICELQVSCFPTIFFQLFICDFLDRNILSIYKIWLELFKIFYRKTGDCRIFPIRKRADFG